MGTFKIGKYGRYYEYEDVSGRVKRISCKNTLIDEDQMDRMISGQTVEIQQKSLFGVNTQKAWLVPYITKDGKPTTIIKSQTVSEKDDRVTLKQNYNKLIPQVFIADIIGMRHSVEKAIVDLDLVKHYLVYVKTLYSDSRIEDSKKLDNKKYAYICVYRMYNGQGMENPQMRALDTYVVYDNYGNFLNEIDEKTFTHAQTTFEKEMEMYKDEIAKIEAERKRLKAELQSVRNNLFIQARNDLEKCVEGVSTDEALNLGYFFTLKTLLVKIKSQDDALFIICNQSFQDIQDVNELRKRLLYLLRVYYDFHNINEKNVLALAKFSAVHNIKDYLDAILEFDEAIEVIVNNTADKELIKKGLSKIAGTSKVNFLKDSSFYFEKTATIKKCVDGDVVIVINPVQLVEELRELIPLYNERSMAAILVNLVLNPDESIVYQFYSYSKDDKGKDMDGRRLQYLAKLYNYNHKKKVYFTYGDGSETDEE